MSDTEQLAAGQEEDRPALAVDCLDGEGMRAALISTTGNHCRVWRSSRKSLSEVTDGYTEFVVKYPKDGHDFADARILARQYRMLRDALGEIVPEALFVMTCIEGSPNLFVLARAVNVWFNIANPANREEAIGLLREYPLARAQLARFVDVARRWRSGPNPRVIDLYGLDNLVMDNQRQVRFIDSFYVFFFEDMLHLLGGERDYELEEKIGLSLRRLAYLDDILACTEAGAPGEG
ncbi:MAG: hypothetical protein KDJ33_11435 [Gammaproteobacteria bacterium]|nr:hypothetical protein [Gammaproteobacteria bacterium]